MLRRDRRHAAEPDGGHRAVEGGTNRDRSRTARAAHRRRFASTSPPRSSSCSRTLPTTRDASSPAISCSRGSGATTTSGTVGRSTCTSAGCAPSCARWVVTTTSGRCAGWATPSLRRVRHDRSTAALQRRRVGRSAPAGDTRPRTRRLAVLEVLLRGTGSDFLVLTDRRLRITRAGSTAARLAERPIARPGGDEPHRRVRIGRARRGRARGARTPNSTPGRGAAWPPRKPRLPGGRTAAAGRGPSDGPARRDQRASSRAGASRLHRQHQP